MDVKDIASAIGLDAIPDDALSSAGPDWEPTDEQRDFVRASVAMGAPTTEIARLIRRDGRQLTVLELSDYFADELEGGAWQAEMKVGSALFRHAVTGEGAASVNAGKFWLQTRSKERWTPSEAVVHQGPDGEAIKIKHEVEMASGTVKDILNAIASSKRALSTKE